MPSRPLNDAERANFQTLLKAAENGDLALISGADAKTGEARAIIAAISFDPEGGQYHVTPCGPRLAYHGRGAAARRRLATSTRETDRMRHEIADAWAEDAERRAAARRERDRKKREQRDRFLACLDADDRRWLAKARRAEKATQDGA